MESLPRLNKMQALQQMLATYGTIYVHVDSRRSGVMLPPSLMNKPQVPLLLGLDLPVPIRDLKCDVEGWSATLSFNRRPFFCVIPWSAVYCIMSEAQYGYRWTGDTPPEVEQQIKDETERAAAKVAQSDKPAAKSRMPAGWRVLDGGKKDVVVDRGGPNPPPLPVPPKAG